MQELGKVGVWWNGPWQLETGLADVAAEIEGLGYGALWSSGGFGASPTTIFGSFLRSTTRLVVASGIVSIWHVSPDQVSDAVTELTATYGERFLLGLGVSHASFSEDYARPYVRMVAYLDALDQLGPMVVKNRRVLAALGPRMLTLAAQRSAGAHPYFVPVEHTARARETLGDGPLLAPEVTVLLEREADKARDLARSFIARYLSRPNYVNNLRSLEFGDVDFAEGGSDRLVDALVCWGDTEKVAERVREHHEAGADHVSIRIIPISGDSFPVSGYRALARTLL